MPMTFNNNLFTSIGFLVFAVVNAQFCGELKTGPTTTAN